MGHTLRAGQVIRGEVVKLYPHQTAQIKLGKRLLIAKLGTPLSVGQHYHFQVQSTESTPHLKVLGALQESTSLKEQAATLLDQLSITKSKSNLNLANTLLRDEIPFNRKQLVMATRLLGATDQQNAGIQAIKQLLIRQIPLNHQTYHALLAVETTELSGQLESLLEALNSLPERTAMEEDVRAQIRNIINHNHSVESMPRNLIQDLFMNQLMKIVKQLGLSYENKLIHHIELGKQIESLKPSLMQLMSHSSNQIKDQSQQLLHLLNGLQIKSVQETNHLIHTSIQLPGQAFKLPHDIYIDMEGRRSESGEINPDYCRIVCYLDLRKLEETVIDLHIQKRHVSITIYNNHPIKSIAKRFESKLAEGLEAQGFTLTSVLVRPLTSKKNQHTYVQVTKDVLHTHSEGYDFRI